MGSLAWFWPEMWGNGYSTVSALLTAAPLWQTLLALLLCKLLATAATSGSGAVGGIFTPMLFVGAAGGALIGLSLNALWPGAAPLAGVIVTGMAAFGRHRASAVAGRGHDAGDDRQLRPDRALAAGLLAGGAPQPPLAGRPGAI